MLGIMWVGVVDWVAAGVGSALPLKFLRMKVDLRRRKTPHSAKVTKVGCVIMSCHAHAHACDVVFSVAVAHVRL